MLLKSYRTPTGEESIKRFALALSVFMYKCKSTKQACIRKGPGRIFSCSRAVSQLQMFAARRL